MERLVNPNILDLTHYKPVKPLEEIKRIYNLERLVVLAFNENPLPIPKNVQNVIRDEAIKSSRYPDFDNYFLRKRIAEYNGVDVKNVIVGAGIIELIRMIINTFLRPDQSVLTSEKTFVYYKMATTEIAGQKAYIEAKMDENYTFNLDAISQLVDDKTKIIFITNPNNPTGTIISSQKIIDFINKIPENIIVVLDNAYQEYVSTPNEYFDGIEMAVNRKNVIVMRTFSKIYALAGLRIGYAISNEEIILYLNRTKSPYGVSNISQEAAFTSLENDEFKEESIKLNLKNKKKLFNQLKEIGLKVIPSETNFLLFIPQVDTPKLQTELLKEGVLVGDLHSYGVPEGIRVTIGLEEDNDFFIKKLKKVLNEIAGDV